MHFLGRRTHFARAIIVQVGLRNFLAKRKKILEKEEEKEHEDEDEEEGEKVCSDARERTRGK
jgi:hypothetical protein